MVDSGTPAPRRRRRRQSVDRERLRLRGRRLARRRPGDQVASRLSSPRSSARVSDPVVAALALVATRRARQIQRGRHAHERGRHGRGLRRGGLERRGRRWSARVDVHRLGVVVLVAFFDREVVIRIVIRPGLRCWAPAPPGRCSRSSRRAPRSCGCSRPSPWSSAPRLRRRRPPPQIVLRSAIFLIRKGALRPPAGSAARARPGRARGPWGRQYYEVPSRWRRRGPVNARAGAAAQTLYVVSGEMRHPSLS